MRVAIVGSGLAGLAAYATLRHGGVAPDEIAVFGTESDPLRAWATRARSIRQTHMRSESDGHLGASAFPGLALREATPRALFATATNRYRPSVDLFLTHAARVRERSGWNESFVARRIESVRAVDGGFTLDGDGPFAHVLLALGHPGLNTVPGTVHAYEPHEYADRVAVIGAGMAAATEWRNARAAGAEVVSVRRREPLRRPLNVPREYFSKRGLASFHRLPPLERAGVLRSLTAPSYPPGKSWDVPVPVVAEPPAGYQAIAATGFKRGFREDALLADLADAHGLEMHERWLVLDADSTIPALTDERRTLSVAGVAGQWSFPAADTIAGAKYAARGFLRRVCRTRS